jgi:hypothetical protein
MGDLVTPDELPNWVPGQVTVDSAKLRWQGVRVRGYRYSPLDVPIPGMREYVIVAYKDGATTMNRRSTGDWRKEQVAPGSVSLLTHAAQSHWRWSEEIEVTHVYLSPGTMAHVAAEAYDCHVKEVELRDVLKADDPREWRVDGGVSRESVDKVDCIVCADIDIGHIRRLTIGVFPAHIHVTIFALRYFSPRPLAGFQRA